MPSIGPVPNRRFLLFLFLSALVIGLTGPSLFAEVTDTAPPSTAQTELDPTIDSTFVTLDGHVLFQVRGMAGFSAADRARAITGRIKAVAANLDIPADSITAVAHDNRSTLMAGDVVLATITDSDAALERLPRALMTEQARRNIVRGIEDFRHDRSSKILIRRGFMALGATALLLLVLFLIGRLFRSLTVAAERNIKTRMESLETRSSSVVESRPLWVALAGIVTATRIVVVAMVVYFYLNLVLGLFPWTRPLATRLFSLFIDPLEVIGAKVIASIPDLAFLVILWFVVRYVLKVTRLFFAAVDRGALVFADFESEWAWPTYRIVRLLIICFAVVVAYPYIPGSNSDAFKGVSLFVGVLFSLGSTSFIANIIGGLALTYRRAFRVGDVIKMGDARGVVTDMRLQATHIRTVKNESIVIPNSELVNSHVTNYSTLARGNGVILHTRVGIGYETPWRQVEAMLLMAAERTPGLKAGSKPFVLQRSLGDFAVDYELNVYCDAPLTMLAVYNDLHKNVLDVFNEFGVQIMTPAYEGDPETPKIVPKDQWHAAPADRSSAKP